MLARLCLNLKLLQVNLIVETLFEYQIELKNKLKTYYLTSCPQQTSEHI